MAWPHGTKATICWLTEIGFTNKYGRSLVTTTSVDSIIRHSDGLLTCLNSAADIWLIQAPVIKIALCWPLRLWSYNTCTTWQTTLWEPTDAQSSKKCRNADQHRLQFGRTISQQHSSPAVYSLSHNPLPSLFLTGQLQNFSYAARIFPNNKILLGLIYQCPVRGVILTLLAVPVLKQPWPVGASDCYQCDQIFHIYDAKIAVNLIFGGETIIFHCHNRL